MRAVGKCAGTCGNVGFDEVLIEASDFIFGEDACENGEGSPIGVRCGRHVVCGHERTDFTDTAQEDGSLTVLGWLFGISCIEFAFRFGDRSEVLGREFKCFGDFELPGNDQYNVVRLIKAAIEVLEVIDGNSFDIGAIPDGGFSIVVPFVSDGLDAL